MRKFLLIILTAAAMWSCKNEEKKETTEEVSTKTDSAMDKPAVDLPYTASYSSNFNDNVSDEDLKLVLESYKDWADSNMTALTAKIADTLAFENYKGEFKRYTNAEIGKLWGTFRDSLSNIRIEMEAWKKLRAEDKNENYVIVWYKEYDTYKNGKIDSSGWHDINQVVDGKISFYRQYRRPLR
jgi:hypothetical protein